MTWWVVPINVISYRFLCIRLVIRWVFSWRPIVGVLSWGTIGGVFSVLLHRWYNVGFGVVIWTRRFVLRVRGRFWRC